VIECAIDLRRVPLTVRRRQRVQQGRQQQSGLVDVGGDRDRLAAPLFGAGIARRQRAVAEEVVLIGEPCDAEVEQPDPALLVDVEMSPLSVPELAFVQITDPTGPRFAIDRDLDGRDTLFGTASRNIPEETRAMQAGLAPGQVRRGLRLLSGVLDSMASFCALLGKEIYLIEPLFYHSAILYERRGCGYLMGRDVMGQIHAGFSEGGVLMKALDGSSHFRRAEAAGTVRGRSWALHDGVIDGLWGGAGVGSLKMYRAAGRPAGIATFPDAPY
jgi:hypothetical protein